MTRVTSHTKWATALAALPSPHVLQSWEWSEFKARYGWRPERRLWSNNEQPRAAASVLTRQLGRLPIAVSYVPKGPILDYTDTALLEKVLSHLENTARRERALFIKIDPDIRINTPTGKAVTETLRRRGWCASREQVQFRNTMLLDLTRDPDEILAAMKSKWRYNVRLAGRKGVLVRPGTLADLPLLYRLYAETATRDGFVIRPEGYYRDAWGSFMGKSQKTSPQTVEVNGKARDLEATSPKGFSLKKLPEGETSQKPRCFASGSFTEAGLAQPLIAEVEGEAVAMVIIFRLQKRAWYMYGASRNAHREKMPNHLLQWEAMLWAREQGCTVYDMWGAPDVLNESDPMWGVYRFKQGFGGEFVEHIGAWDFPTSRIGYWLYSSAMPRVLAAMRWLHWRQSANKASSA